MDTSESIEIIERMFNESKKSLCKNSFYFILWGLIMVPIGIAESLMIGQPNFWIVWPIAGVIGGIISMIYGFKESKKTTVYTAGDRISNYTWGAFAITLVIAVAFSVYNHISPHAMVLLLAGSATFISGGTSKFTPFIWGGIALMIGAILCAFFITPEFQGYISAISLFIGYVIPGFMLRKLENGKA
jgi:hypothetical protein